MDHRTSVLQGRTQHFCLGYTVFQFSEFTNCMHAHNILICIQTYLLTYIHSLYM